MTREDFMAAQAKLKHSNPEMATAIFSSLSLVEKIRDGHRPVSPRTAKIVTALMKDQPCE
jgi:hypothetical protein